MSKVSQAKPVERAPLLGRLPLPVFLGSFFRTLAPWALAGGLRQAGTGVIGARRLSRVVATDHFGHGNGFVEGELYLLCQ